ncbi:hypothetical protein QD47_20840 [Paenibacillus terrae]|uniref:Uncharacterized protein n=2 Tax=Paenibacillus terrae TaxID=159743 RepID=A0A0D7WXV6_9BACL|nr:hypothetical protein QD47_20840 [Paenibacillus terrae]
MVSCGLDFYEICKNGIKPVVEFTEGAQNYESFDPGMRARLVSMWRGEDECFGCEFDFSEFEGYNKSIETPIWVGKRNDESLKWSETLYYPKDKIVKFYIGEKEEEFFVLIENMKPFLDFKESNSRKSYVQWLEERYLKYV